MKRIMTVLGFLSVVSVAGCGGGGEGGVVVGVEPGVVVGGSAGGGGAAPVDTGAVDVPGSPWYVQYPNGHPLAALSTDPNAPAQEDDLVSLINNYRVSLGLGALVPNSQVSDVARAHSIHRVIHDFVGTVNPEGDGPADRAMLVGLGFFQYDENIDTGAANALTVFNDWLSDPGAAALMEDPTWTDIGAGFYEDPSSPGQFYWTVDFLE